MDTLNVPLLNIDEGKLQKIFDFLDVDLESTFDRKNSLLDQFDFDRTYILLSKKDDDDEKELSGDVILDKKPKQDNILTSDTTQNEDTQKDDDEKQKDDEDTQKDDDEKQKDNNNNDNVTKQEEEEIILNKQRKIFVSKFSMQGRRPTMQDFIGDDPFSIEFKNTYSDIERKLLKKIKPSVPLEKNIDEHLYESFVSIPISEIPFYSEASEPSDIKYEDEEEDEDEEDDEEEEDEEEEEEENKREWCDMKETRIFSIFDGHGGSTCAKKCALNFNHFLLKDLVIHPKISQRKILENIFNKFNNIYCSEYKSGSTGSVVVICPKHIFASHVGDSRIVICEIDSDRSIKTVYSSSDHNTENEKELQKLNLQRDVSVMSQGDIPRFKTGLSVTRTLGDMESDRYVSRMADVFVRTVQDDKDYWVVMASDGFWDVVDTDLLVSDFIGKINSKTPFSNTSLEWAKKAYDLGSGDNITIQIICLIKT